MDDKSIFFSFGVNELLDSLKPYQRDSIRHLINEFGEEEAAKKWLSANGPVATQQFGGLQNGNAHPFWDRFIAEFRLLICDEKYAPERNKILSGAKPSALVIISGISGYIGSTLGFAPALLAPAVAVILPTIGKVGINAWCKCEQQ